MLAHSGSQCLPAKCDTALADSSGQYLQRVTPRGNTPVSCAKRSASSAFFFGPLHFDVKTVHFDVKGEPAFCRLPKGGRVLQ